MIRNDAELKHAVEQLQRMYAAMAELYQGIYPKNPKQFALFSEGPNDQIAELQKEIDEYTGRDKLERQRNGKRVEAGVEGCCELRALPMIEVRDECPREEIGR